MSKIYVDEILPKDNVKIAAADLQLPAGSVIQVVQNTTGGSVNNSTSQTFSAAISVNITPKSSSSKVLVSFSGCYDTDDGGRQIFFRIIRTSSGVDTIVSGNDTTLGSAWDATDRQISNMNVQYLDSPSSTDTITYTLQFAPWNSYNVEWNSQGVRSVAIAQEIAQ